MSSPLSALSSPDTWAVFARRLAAARDVDVSRAVAPLRSSFALRPIMQPLSTLLVSLRPASAPALPEALGTTARSWDGAARIIVALGPEAFTSWLREEFDSDPSWADEVVAALGPTREAAAELDRVLAGATAGGAGAGAPAVGAPPAPPPPVATAVPPEGPHAAARSVAEPTHAPS